MSCPAESRSRRRRGLPRRRALWRGMRALGVAAFLAAPLFAMSLGAAKAQALPDEGGFVTHKLALQISDNDEQKMRSALDIAANVSRYYTDRAEEVDIEIVVYGPGMVMLRPDKTPVMDRLTSFSQSMPNVSFAACGNTLDTLERREGRRPQIVPFATVVEAGVVELIRLNEDGYTIVKP